MIDLVVRADIRQQYADLFGERSVGGRRVSIEELIASLTRATRDEFRAVLEARHRPAAHADARAIDFLPASEVVQDPDGRQATVTDIRQGLVDGFFNRKTPHAWRVGATVAIPAETTRPGLEGTGPCIDLGMAMGAINAGASSWMWDWEDAGGDYRDQLYQAWRNLKQLLAGEWRDRTFEHPTKTEPDPERGPGATRPRRYRIEVADDRWPTIFHRVPGLHLHNRQMTLDNDAVPAIIPALVIHALNNYDAQVRRGSGIYFYVPKLQTWQEARLIGTLLRELEQAMGVARGTIKIKVLNERVEFVLQQEAIQWVLRENLIGPNVGRWDYLNSREDVFRDDPRMVIPDPAAVTMTEPSMTAYTRRNAVLALLAGATPIGGMAAQMPNPRRPELDAKALRDIWFDKLRERLTGLFVIDGQPYDTYRQSWVATVSPAYVAAGREPLTADTDDLQRIVDQTTPGERVRLETLGLIAGGRITPRTLSAADLTVDALFSSNERDRLLARPDGPTTEDGLRYAMYMATEYMYQQLHGNNAAAIDDPNTGLRFMNDLATYEIFWHFLALTVQHGVVLTADGQMTTAGERVTPDLFLRLLDERRETVRAFFASRGIDYASTDADLVLDVLRRQVVEDGSDGAARPRSRWIQYGSRVLLSIVERSPAERAAILHAIFADRADTAARIDTATSDEARRLAELGLAAHDYVYDVFERDHA
jgi:malate synthase